MRAKDKRKLRLPASEPDPHQGSGCEVWVGTLFAVSLAGVLVTDSKIVFGLFAVLAALSVLLVAGHIAEKLDIKRLGEWAKENKRFAIVVTSDSPKWTDHINNNWLARFGEHVSVLNHSQRREWPRSFESQSVRKFNYIEGDHPVVIIPRSSGRPAVYRFRAAFIAAFHGDDSALQEMEQRLFGEYAEWRARL